MKIGILTFHSQLNYGGVLQCWALQTALEQLGHEIVVIDRWLDNNNASLECVYKNMGLKQWVRFVLRICMCLGDLKLIIRSHRTKKFIKRHLNLTPYHFVEWSEAPKDLDLDVLVVGSDQIWHCGDFSDPRVYLLEGAPRVPAIAYAASFGMAKLPESYKELYLRGLSKFKAISCREVEGVEICRKLGFDATHVVDPTLLAWGADSESMFRDRKKRELVCYFLSECVEAHIAELEDFARKNKCKVKILINEAYLLPIPTNLAGVKKVVCGWRNRFYPHVKIVDASGPEEFMAAFKSAQWVVSDSFHALMFSICYGCDPRMIKPSSPFRQKMFARIEEFNVHAQGPLVADTVSSALESLANGERVMFDYSWISAQISKSKTWIASALA